MTERSDVSPPTGGESRDQPRPAVPGMRLRLEPERAGESDAKLQLDVTGMAYDAASAYTTAVVVKVSQDDYVPAGIQVRAQISPTLFTTEVSARELEQLQQDPAVSAISRSKAVYPTTP